jgi:heptaprenyl diphosphate synthase
MPITDDLDINTGMIEKYLREFFLEDMDLVPESHLSLVISGLIGTGGKRLRPALLITGAKFGEKFKRNEKAVYRAAALIEAVHLSSLIHDDIIDRSQTRRNKATLYSELGSRKAVFAGSYIFSRAAELLSEYIGYDKYSRINNGLRAMCRSEIRQIENRFDFNTGLLEYLRKSRAKTAKLISTCLFTGAVMGGADDETADRLEVIGTEIGMAFQITDDILDFTQKSEVFGKPTGSDLKSGNVTLPLIYAMDDILKLMPGFITDVRQENLDRAIDIVKQCGAIEKSYVFCKRLLDRSAGKLEKIRAGKEAKDDLGRIIEYIYTRKY